MRFEVDLFFRVLTRPHQVKPSVVFIAELVDNQCMLNVNTKEQFTRHTGVIEALILPNPSFLMFL